MYFDTLQITNVVAVVLLPIYEQFVPMAYLNYNSVITNFTYNADMTENIITSGFNVNKTQVAFDMKGNVEKTA